MSFNLESEKEWQPTFDKVVTVCRRVLPTRKTVSAAKKKRHFKKGKKGIVLQLLQRMSAYLTNSFHMGVSHVIQTIHLHNKVLEIWVLSLLQGSRIVESCNPGLVSMEKMESTNQMT